MISRIAQLLGAWGVSEDPTNSQAYVVSKELVHRLIELAFGTKAFDEHTYLEKNLDVAKAVAEGEFMSGRHHYMYVGIVENRKLSERALDELAYLLANPDVKAAVDVGGIESGKAHWERIGWIEGRPV